jgi:ligand-binding sensor domain-containing protein
LVCTDDKIVVNFLNTFKQNSQANYSIVAMSVRIILFFALLAVIVHPGYGSDNYVRYYTIDNGLTQNEVTKVIQDSKGFLWFATRGGLNKFDGHNFTHFTSNINYKSILLNPSIECLHEDRKGNIWIGTKSGGLDLYNPKLATSRNFNTSDSSKIRLSGNHIISILEDSEGDLWFGTWTKGVTFYDPKNDSVHYLLPNTRVSVMTEYDKNNIWFGTNQGIYVYNKNERKMTHLQLGHPDFDVTKLIIDHKNKVVWYTGWGKCLIRYSLENQKSTEFNIDVKQSPSSTATQIFNGFSLMLDSKGFIWLG